MLIKELIIIVELKENGIIGLMSHFPVHRVIFRFLTFKFYVQVTQHALLPIEAMDVVLISQ